MEAKILIILVYIKCDDGMNKILEDIRVLDLTIQWFGPFCTMMLADFGAEVIKIEPPWGTPDRFTQGPVIAGASPWFHYLNLGKKDLTLNLKENDGIDIFKELVKRSDVVIQNFAPGTMERLKLGSDVFSELNPKIIYAALSGFGQTGPYYSMASFASIAEAMSGHLRLCGDNIDPNGPPQHNAEAYGDLGPAMFAAMSIIAAIRYRDKTGKGQMIDVAQADCMTALCGQSITTYLFTGLLPWQIKEKYAAMQGIGGIIKVTDGWIQVSGIRPRALDNLKEKLNVNEVTTETLEKLISSMNRKEAVEYIASFGMPVAPIYQVNENIKDPHLISRNMFIDVEHTELGKIKTVNFPVKFSETPVNVSSGAPTLGQNNKEILMDLLGFTEEKVKMLEKKGIIAAASRVCVPKA